MIWIIAACLLPIVVDAVLALREWNNRRFPGDRWGHSSVHYKIEDTF